jgi:hypothetical protein
MNITINSIVFEGTVYQVEQSFISPVSGDLFVQFFIGGVLISLPLTDLEVLINEPVYSN